MSKRTRARTQEPVPETADCVGNRFFKVKEPALIICLFKSPLTSLEAAVLRWSVNYSTFLTAESQWWRPSREVCVRIQQVPFTLMFWGNCRLTFSSNSFNVKGVFYLNNHNKNKKCPCRYFPLSHNYIHGSLLMWPNVTLPVFPVSSLCFMFTKMLLGWKKDCP